MYPSPFHVDNLTALARPEQYNIRATYVDPGDTLPGHISSGPRRRINGSGLLYYDVGAYAEHRNIHQKTIRPSRVVCYYAVCSKQKEIQLCHTPSRNYREEASEISELDEHNPTCKGCAESPETITERASRIGTRPLSSVHADRPDAHGLA